MKWLRPNRVKWLAIVKETQNRQNTRRILSQIVDVTFEILVHPPKKVKFFPPVFKGFQNSLFPVMHSRTPQLENVKR